MQHHANTENLLLLSLLELLQYESYQELVLIYEEELITRKLWGILKYTMTLATAWNTIIHSHRWQNLCKRMAKRTFKKLFAYMAGGFLYRFLIGETSTMAVNT